MPAANLKQLAATGKLKPADLVQKEGMNKCVPASAVKGLFPNATATPAVAPPRPLPPDDNGPVPREVAEAGAGPARNSGQAPKKANLADTSLSVPSPAIISPDAAPQTTSQKRKWIGLIAAASAISLTLAGSLIYALIPRSGTATAKSAVVDKTSSSVPVTSRSSLPADYVQLALMISNSFTLEEGKWTDASALKQIGDMDAALKSVNETTNAVLRPAVDKLATGRERAEQIANVHKESAERAQRHEQEVREKAARGEYIREVEVREVVGYGSDGPIYENVRRRVDQSDEPLMLAWFNRKFLASQPEMAKQAVMRSLERSRLEAWGELLPKLGEIYGQKSARNDLATPRIAAADPGKNRPATFAIVNTGGKLLTDVTLAIDLVHFTDAPNVTSRQVLFLPQWPADQAIYLNAASHANMITAQTTRSRPVSARPGFGPGLDSGRPLMGVGGVVEARVAVWAAQAHQPERAVKYPDVAEAGARFEMDALYAITEHEVLLGKGNYAANPKNAKGQSNPASARQPKNPFLIPEEFKSLPPSAWVFRGAPHVSELVPGTALERDAQALLADPVDFIRQRRRKQYDSLMQACAANKRWTGTWTFQITQEKVRPQASFLAPDWVMGVGTPPGGEQIAEVLKTCVGSKGRIALTFEATPAPAAAPVGRGPRQPARTPAANAGPQRFAARIFDPDRASSQRPLIGEIANRHDDKHLILKMITPPPPPSYASRKVKAAAPPRPKPNPAGQHTLENDDLYLELTCDETGLKGFARTTGDRYFRMYRFELALESGGN